MKTYELFHHANFKVTIKTLNSSEKRAKGRILRNMDVDISKMSDVGI